MIISRQVQRLCKILIFFCNANGFDIMSEKAHFWCKMGVGQFLFSPGSYSMILKNPGSDWCKSWGPPGLRLRRSMPKPPSHSKFQYMACQCPGSLRMSANSF